MNIGQTEVAPLELEDVPGVVDPEEVEDGGVQVIDLDGVANDVVREVVGLAEASGRA